MTSAMTPELAALASIQGGVFTRRQALGCDVSAEEFRRAATSGMFERVRRGAYVAAPTWRTADAPGRQVLGLYALTLQTKAPVVGSHYTAAAVHGIELWEPSYDYLHLTRPDHSPRREAAVWHHQSRLLPAEVVVVREITVTEALRTALDIARSADFEHAVVAVDSALRLTGSSVDQLKAAHLRCADWPGARVAGRAVAFADERSGSVGESRLRVGLALGGLPEPETQASIYDEVGRLAGVVDFLLDKKVIVEFDGHVKYGLDGLTPEVVASRLWREKQREDALRRLGYEVVRLTWSDLYHLARVIALVRAALARASATPAPRGSYALQPLRTARAG